jgi:hypothetical protein
MLSSNEGTFYKWQLKQIRTSVSILAWTHTGYKKAVPLPMPRIPIPTLEPQSPYFHTSYQVLQNRFVSWMRLEKCNTFNGILIRFQYNFTKPHKVVFLKMSLQYSLILMWFYQGICIDEILHIHTSQKVCVCVCVCVYLYSPSSVFKKKKKGERKILSWGQSQENVTVPLSHQLIPPCPLPIPTLEDARMFDVQRTLEVI